LKLEQILETQQNFQKYLLEKGFKKNPNIIDKDYPRSTFVELGSNKLAVIHKFDDESEIKKIKEHFLIDMGLTHCILYSNDRILFYRNYGEIRYFIYSKSTYKNPSKIDKLEKINLNFDILFQFKDISKNFYDEFKKHRDLLVRSMNVDTTDVKKYLLGQKIFDRIFFIYFLCHKNIIHFENNQSISGKNLFKFLLDDGDFLRNIYLLFHEFNVEKKSLLKFSDQKIFIPFLNGGLFRINDVEQNISSTWTNSDWKSIFNFLNQYHWIIEDSDEELTEEKILTPEILGHVYERSVVEWEKKGMEDEVSESTGKSKRKAFGVYYTPEYVTDYICRNSLNVWILEKLNNSYASVVEFLENGIDVEFERILIELNSIKIIDPACGSGAFLIKSADLLFKFKSNILSKLKRNPDHYLIKLSIISNNLFGVDILDGATEIAKLRLWLWLISSRYDQNTVSPLPNIEYNIVSGNSLIGWVGQKLDTTTVTAPFSDKVELSLNTLIGFSNLKQKKILEESMLLLNNFSSNDYIQAYSKLYQLYRNSHTKYAKILKQILIIIREEVYSSINHSFLNFINNNSTKSVKKSWSEIDTNPFHWNCDFGGIVKEGGFDIVVGNPPYNNIQGISNKTYQQTLKILFSDVYSGFGDELYLFFRLSSSILKEGGVLGFITSRYFLEAKYAKNLRIYLKENTQIEEIIDFGSKIRIFDEASTNNAITISKNKHPTEDHLLNVALITDWGEDNNSLFEYITQNVSKSIKKDGFEFLQSSQEQLDSRAWTFDNPEVVKIKQKLHLNSKYLGPYPEGCEGVCHIVQSISSGLGEWKNNRGVDEEVFRVTSETIKKKKLEKQLLKPLVKIGMIRRYKINLKDKYLILTTNNTQINEFPKIKKHLGQYKKQLETRHDFINGNFDWWRIVNLRNIDLLESKQDRLFVPMTAPENRFVYVNSNDYFCEGDVYVLMIIDNDFSLRYVQGILNSTLMNLFMKRNAKKLDGNAKTEKSNSGRISYSTHNVKNIPIKIVSKKQQNEIATLVEKIEKLYLEKDLSSTPELIQKEIELTDIEIDLIINKIYDVSTKELEILKL
jgi:hypothetical protein